MRRVPAGGLRGAVTRRQAIACSLAALVLALSLGHDVYAAVLRREPLAIVTANGRFLFTVEVAETPEEQHRGLMGRMAVPPETGMLFDFGQPRPVSMWMHDTPVSLDMLFIRTDGTVAAVAARTIPNSDAIIPAPEPVLAVLELAAGTAERLGIVAGAKVEHPMFARGLR